MISFEKTSFLNEFHKLEAEDAEKRAEERGISGIVD